MGMGVVSVQVTGCTTGAVRRVREFEPNEDSWSLLSFLVEPGQTYYKELILEDICPAAGM